VLDAVGRVVRQRLAVQDGDITRRLKRHRSQIVEMPDVDVACKAPASSEPMVTVTSKSNDVVLEKDRNPTRRKIVMTRNRPSAENVAPRITDRKRLSGMAGSRRA
jgi:phosphoribosylaminoimidazole-succinocarboxamide synthase